MEKNNPIPVTGRRTFLAKVATGLAAVGLGSLVPTSKLKAANPLAEGASEADKWFLKIQGKHRIVFDATSHHEGFPLAWSRIFMNTNNDTGAPDNDINVVVILRHDAIALAMEDRLWGKYQFGKVFKINDTVAKTASLRNMYWKPQPGELHFPDMSIDQLQKRGVMFCVCEVAINVHSSIVAKEMGMDAAEIKKDWLSGLLPSIQIVPSGVWAVGRAQEHGCAYCFAG